MIRTPFEAFIAAVREHDERTVIDVEIALGGRVYAIPARDILGPVDRLPRVVAMLRRLAWVEPREAGGGGDIVVCPFCGARAIYGLEEGRHEEGCDLDALLRDVDAAEDASTNPPGS